MLTGSARPDRLQVDGLDIALIRDKNGRSNWNDDDRDDDTNDRGPVLTDLDVTNSHFSFTDHKRDLSLDGPISVSLKDGLRAEGSGTFLQSKATMLFTGGAIAGIDPEADYPFTVSLQSPALELTAKGNMQGVFEHRPFRRLAICPSANA